MVSPVGASPWRSAPDFDRLHSVSFLGKSEISSIAIALSVSVCVCVCLSVRVCTIFVSTCLNLAKIKKDVCRFWHWQSNSVVEKIVFNNLTYFLKIKKYETSIALKPLELTQKKNTRVDSCRFRYLPSRDNIAIIVLPDRYHLFQGKKCERLISLKRWERKMCGTTFRNSDICHRMMQLRMLYSEILIDFFLKVKYFKW